MISIILSILIGVDIEHASVSPGKISSDGAATIATINGSGL